MLLVSLMLFECVVDIPHPTQKQDCLQLTEKQEELILYWKENSLHAANFAWRLVSDMLFTETERAGRNVSGLRAKNGRLDIKKIQRIKELTFRYFIDYSKVTDAQYEEDKIWKECQHAINHGNRKH